MRVSEVGVEEGGSPPVQLSLKSHVKHSADCKRSRSSDPLSDLRSCDGTLHTKRTVLRSLYWREYLCQQLGQGRLSLKLSYFSPFFHIPGADKDQPFLQWTPRCNNSIYNKYRVESSSKASYTISNTNEWVGHSSSTTWKPNVYVIWKKSAGNMNGITSKRLNLWKMNTQAAAFLNNSCYAIFFVV